MNDMATASLHKQVVEIWDRDGSGVLAVQLPDLLALLPEETQHYTWTILRFEATARPGSSPSLRELEKQVSRSNGGVQFDWARLVSLAMSIDQLLDGTVVGQGSSVAISRQMSKEDLAARCDYILEVCDSTFGRIVTDSGLFLSRIRSRFHDVREPG